MPQNSQHTIRQTLPKHFSQFRSVITEEVRWLLFTKALGKKLKFETDRKHIYQHLLKIIPIEIIKVDKQP